MMWVPQSIFGCDLSTSRVSKVEKIWSPSLSVNTQAPSMYFLSPDATLSAAHRADILSSIFSPFMFRALAPNLSLTWRERLLAPAKALFPLPSRDRLQLAQLASTPPTAALILSEYTDLKPGDWIVQNGANSGVGRSLIAIAKKRGFRTINVVRRRELIDEIKQAGGDIVLDDDPASVSAAAH